MGRKQIVKPVEETPWDEGDPAKKISLNVPFPEPLMLQLDWLISQNAIRSKSSFIRDAVSMAASEEVARVRKVMRAVREMDERDKSRR